MPYDDATSALGPQRTRHPVAAPRSCEQPAENMRAELGCRLDTPISQYHGQSCCAHLRNGHPERLHERRRQAQMGGADENVGNLLTGDPVGQGHADADLELLSSDQYVENSRGSGPSPIIVARRTGSCPRARATPRSRKSGRLSASSRPTSTAWSPSVHSPDGTNRHTAREPRAALNCPDLHLHRLRACPVGAGPRPASGAGRVDSWQERPD